MGTPRGSDPQKWRVLGSNDGTTFEELAAMENPGFRTRRERKTWKIEKPGAYRFYRLAIGANGGGLAQDRTTPCTQLAEFDLLDAAGKSIIRSGSDGFQSRWVSETGANEWLKVDLGAPSRVDAVSVKWAKGGEAEVSHIEISADGKAWTRGTRGKDVRFVKLVCEKAKGDVFDVHDPRKLLARLDEPYFWPEADFEKTGQYRDGTVFTEGLVFYKGKWHLYYGCADSFVGYAVWAP